MNKAFTASQRIIVVLIQNVRFCCVLQEKMSGVKARKWVVRSHFVGQPKREDLEIVEEELPSIKDGGQGVGVVPSLA